jgi:ADP-ribose pyrophosphatase YjhB (NUDIX family)
MEPRQVFRDYDGPADANPARFCIACGSALEDVEEGGHAYKRCTACKRPHWRNPSPTVTVLVVKDRHLLLCLRSARMLHGGKWCIPGGFIEWGEDFITAGRREVREETGLEVEIKGIINIASNQHTPDASTISVILVAEPLSGEATPLDETDAVCWHPFDEPLPEMAFAHQEHLIRRYIANPFAGAPVDPRYARGPAPALQGRLT